MLLKTLREREDDAALLIVDGMGAEFIPLLLAMSKRLGMHIESCLVTTANIPTETKFNLIEWNEDRKLPPIKGVDAIVHDGAVKHEASSPEHSFAKTLQIFETDVMERIADGLSRFSRVIVTADHGSSRLAVIAGQENKGKTLSWDEKNGAPLNWRYTVAPKAQRPSEFESCYVPDTETTYWVVRGYNRLPKKGGKIYGLHGGTTLEERLIPVFIFTREAISTIPKSSCKKFSTELRDNLDGLI